MLKGVVSLVTGGASGLGRATVERIVREGGRVVLCDLPTSEGDQVAKEIGDHVTFASADIRSETDVRNALNTCKDHYGRLDVVVSCAGLATSIVMYNKKLKRIHNPVIFKNIVDVNLFGTFNVARLAAVVMSENEPNENGQRGVIINTASSSAIDGQAGLTAYAASTAGIVGMTYPMALDLSSFGIRVCTIAPGLFKTPMIPDMEKVKYDFLEETIPFPQRLGKPEEYAMLVQDIILNPMINGATIRLDAALRYTL